MSKSDGTLIRIQFFLACLLAFSLPNLNLLMSIGTILLFITWWFHPGPAEGWRRIKKNKVLLLLLGLFGIHLIWLLNTQDFGYAFKDLRIKLTLPVLVFALGTLNFGRRQVMLILFAFSLGLWVAMIQIYANYFELRDSFFDPRSLVSGISHIRLGLMSVLLVTCFFYYWNRLNGFWKLYGVITLSSVALCLNLFQSATGSMILGILIIFSLIYWLWQRSKNLSWIALSGVLLILFSAGFYVKTRYDIYYTPIESSFPEGGHTERGNPYYHYPSFQVEKGNYVFSYISEKELQKAWNSRSEDSIFFDPPANEERIAVLMRYLTSKGLKKDFEGVMSLSEEDIENIEDGVPSEGYVSGTGLERRLHSLLYSYHVYENTGDASGLSLFQRTVYWRVGLYLSGKYFWFGTGTGDVKNAFNEAYDELNINLEEKFRLRAHNQYLTFFVTFGIAGFIFFAILLVAMGWNAGGNYLRLCFLILISLSFLTEDTLETQAGITFFAFFSTLFFGSSRLDAPTD